MAPFPARQAADHRATNCGRVPVSTGWWKTIVDQPLEGLILPGLQNPRVVRALVSAPIRDAFKTQTSSHLFKRLVFMFLEPPLQIVANCGEVRWPAFEQ